MWLFIIVWSIIGKCVNWIMESNEKASRNIVSAIHAVTVIGHAYTTIDVSLLFYWSSSYYIIDLVNELLDITNSKTIKSYQIGMAAHHIISAIGLSYLTDPITCNYLYPCFILAEVSNLPMYIVRHFHTKLKKNNWVLFIALIIELAVYFWLRVVICGVIIMFMYPHTPIHVNIMASFIYFISVYWSIKLFIQTVNVHI